MDWQALILLQTVVMSVGVLFFRSVARRPKAHNATFAVGAVQSLFVLIGITLMVPLLGNFEPAKLQQYFWWFVLAGLGATIANACSYKVYAYLEAGLATIFTTVYVVFVAIFGAIILHEYLTTNQIIGTIILFVAICYGAILAKHPDIKKRNEKAWMIGLGFSLLAGVLYGGTVTNEKFLVDNMSASTVIFGIFLAQTIFTFIFAILMQPKMFSFAVSKPVLKPNILNGLLRAAGAALGVLAIVKSDNVVIVTIIANFKLILVIILAAIFLKEHQKLRLKLVDAAIATVGLVVIFWQ